MVKKLLSIRLRATFLAAVSGKSKNGEEARVSKKKIALFAFLYAFPKDHSTVMYNIKKVEVALKDGDTSLQNNIRDITANINSCL